jgi:prenyltransferase beta subunit
MQISPIVGTVAGFLLGQLNPDGGFRDRAGNSDLYYTVFGLEGLLALSVEPPCSLTAAYLRTFGAGEELDFVHLACLARCWATVSRDLQDVPRDRIATRIETFRSAGGYNQTPGAPHATIYASFLALGAYHDLRCEMPERHRVLDSIAALQARDGGYANRPGMAAGLTTATAAAVTLFRHLQQEIDPRLGEWLRSRCRPEGGFFASPAAPDPDLLSTASALHALSGMQMPLGEIQDPCLDFVDSLWNKRGGFYGSWADDTLDCEYTYYALLALGHLSL